MSEEKMFCSNCGNEVNENQNFCSVCGTSTENTFICVLKNIFLNNYIRTFAIATLVLVLLPLNIVDSYLCKVANIVYPVLLVYLIISFFIIGLKQKFSLQIAERFVGTSTAILILACLFFVRTWLISPAELPISLAHITGIYVTGIIPNDTNIDMASVTNALYTCVLYTVIVTSFFLILLNYYRVAIRKLNTNLQYFFIKTTIFSYIVYFINLIFILIGTIIKFYISCFLEQRPFEDVTSICLHNYSGIFSAIIISFLLYVGINTLLFNKLKG